MALISTSTYAADAATAGKTEQAAKSHQLVLQL